MKKVINTEKAPAAIGPYSQVIEFGNLVFLSGQLGIDPATGEFPSDDVEEQCEQVFRNIQALLTEAGLAFSDVIKCTVFLADMADFAKVNAIYAKYFQAPYPARSAFAVAQLPKAAKVEIEVIAGK